MPQAQIVFDQFHVVAAFGRVIDTIRNSEYRKAAAHNKQVFKGSKYLLLKNRANVRRKKGGGPHCLDSLMGGISSESLGFYLEKHQAASANG